MLVQQNHAAGGANGSIMVVVFVSCVFQVFCSKKPSELGCAFRIFFLFRTGLIFRNPPDSADSVRFCGTQVKIISSRARLICPKSDGIRLESGGKDK